jgi:hypothetical protein
MKMAVCTALQPRRQPSSRKYVGDMNWIKVALKHFFLLAAFNFRIGRMCSFSVGSSISWLVDWFVGNEWYAYRHVVCWESAVFVRELIPVTWPHGHLVRAFGAFTPCLANEGIEWHLLPLSTGGAVSPNT